MSCRRRAAFSSRCRWLCPSTISSSQRSVISLGVSERDEELSVQCVHSTSRIFLEKRLNVSGDLEGSEVWSRPLCSYAVRTGDWDGPVAEVVRIGEPLFHSWACEPSA